MNAIYRSAASGVQAQQRALDVAADNLANVSTTGFKRSRPNFRELAYESLVGVQSATDPTQITPMPAVGTGVGIFEVQQLHDQGAFQDTGRQLDLALQGKGYFVVTQPDGQPAYTRDGSFHLDDNRRLVTSGGLSVLPQEMPEWAASVRVEHDGTVYAVDGDGTREERVGVLSVVTFPNEGALRRTGDNLWQATPEAGEPVAWGEGNPYTGSIEQGILERSNVDLGDEMTRVMEAQRAYQMSLKVLQTIDEMQASATQLSR